MTKQSDPSDPLVRYLFHGPDKGFGNQRRHVHRRDTAARRAFVLGFVQPAGAGIAEPDAVEEPRLFILIGQEHVLPPPRADRVGRQQVGALRARRPQPPCDRASRTARGDLVLPHENVLTRDRLQVGCHGNVAAISGVEPLNERRIFHRFHPPVDPPLGRRDNRGPDGPGEVHGAPAGPEVRRVNHDVFVAQRLDQARDCVHKQPGRIAQEQFQAGGIAKPLGVLDVVRFAENNAVGAPVAQQQHELLQPRDLFPLLRVVHPAAAEKAHDDRDGARPILMMARHHDVLELDVQLRRDRAGEDDDVPALDFLRLGKAESQFAVVPGAVLDVTEVQAQPRGAVDVIEHDAVEVMVAGSPVHDETIFCQHKLSLYRIRMISSFGYRKGSFEPS